MSHRYFVTTDARGEREVDKAEYVKVERLAGFNNTLGQPLEPATASFSVTTRYGSARGRTEYVREVA